MCTFSLVLLAACLLKESAQLCRTTQGNVAELSPVSSTESHLAPSQLSATTYRQGLEHQDSLNENLPTWPGCGLARDRPRAVAGRRRSQGRHTPAFSLSTFGRPPSLIGRHHGCSSSNQRRSGRARVPSKDTLARKIVIRLWK